MKKAWLWLGCLVIQTTSAQPFIDIASAGFHQWSESGDAPAASWVTSHVSVPATLGDDILLTTAAFEQYEHSDFRVYGVSLPVAYVWKVNDRWKMTGSVIPRLSSDMEAVSSDDYQLGGAVLATRKGSDFFSFKFGAYYNSEFFGFFMLPLAGVEWKINDRLHLGGILPRKMVLEYKAAPGRIHLGGLFRSVTNSFRTLPGSYIRISDNQVRFFVDAYLFANIVMNAEMGYSVFRKYKAGSRSGGTNDEVELSSGDRPLFRLSVAYRVRFDN
jgi:hypothetical protein